MASSDLMKPLDASEVVLLVVEHPHVEEAIALRDPSRHAIMAMDAGEESRASLLIAMGAEKASSTSSAAVMETYASWRRPNGRQR